MVRGGRILVAVAVAGALLAGAVLAMARGRDDVDPGCRMLLIPAYVPPDELEALAREVHPRLIVVNPASGPGTEPVAGYRDAVGTLRRAGATVLGYVPTTYGARDAAQAQADIDRYRDWYETDGVFLDEAAGDAGHVPYYRALADHARGDGERTVVLNPGVVPDRGYFDVADVVVTFEGTFAQYEQDRPPAWLGELPRDQVAVLVHGATRAQAADVVSGAGHAGYAYATPGVLPHPWGTVPAYITQEAAMIEECTP